MTNASAPTVAPTTTSPAPTRNAHPKFIHPDKFLKELRARVDAYFEQTGKKKRDVPQMYFKTATILLWFFAAYFILLFVASSWYTVVPLAVLLGLAVAAIGFNIQHDAGHKAYSDRPWVNKLMSLTLDLMGGSSYLWDWKHNSIHHTYTNIEGHDDDINVGFLARMHPEQTRLKFHRFQGIYLWFLYGFLAIKWHLVDDFYNLAVGRIGEFKIPRPKGKDLAIFIGGKVIFFSMAFVVPILLHGWMALLVYALAAFVSGVTMAVVFQLAHVVEEADMPAAPPAGERMPSEWAVHQIQTTVDFSRSSRFLTWFLGGLNFQVEHHLFHRICHIHYPALSKVVEDACREFGVRYNAHKSIFSAIASHYRLLVQMGRPTTA